MKILNGNKFALYIDKSVEFISLVIAIWKTGGTYIPIDTEMPKSRIEYMLHDSKVNCIVKDKNSRYDFKGKKFLVDSFFDKTFENIRCYDYKDKIINDDIAYIIYTSGSTGKPKGVKVSNNNLTYFMHSIDKEIEIASDDKWLSITTVCFDISILEIFFPIIKGITLVIGTKRMLIDMSLLKKTIVEENITIMQATPITWNLLANSDISILKDMKILCGGDRMSKELSEKLYNIAKKVLNLYGPTETTIWSSVNQLQYAGDTSIGTPLEGTKFYLFDDKMMLNNIEGELYIGGKGVSLGYINNVSLTNQKYIKNPLNGKETIYQTGDYVKYIDGRYYCIGRNDFQIKINGHRIELEDIEKNLMKIHGVEMAIVIPNYEKSNIFAFVKCKGEKLTEIDIKEELRNRIIGYMIPKRIFFIDEIPLTFNEKVDRKELLNKYVYKNIDNKEENKIEDKLIRIWSNIIGEKVNPNKSYSEYMIDSLTLTQISIEMGKIWNEFSIEDIVKYKTINNIVQHMENKEKEVKIDNKRINKILKDYAISLKDVELIKINENERMMLNFYFLNPRECVFQDCYMFEIESRLNEKDIKNEFLKKTNEMNFLKTKYVFGYDMKIQSKAFNDMVKYSYIELDDKNRLEKIIYNNEIEVNNINECSIKLKVISFENKTYLIFNYPHIRMDELSFFDLVNAILTQIILKGNSYGMRILNEVHSGKNIIINMDKNQMQKCVKEAKLYSTNINNIVEYHMLKALKEQYNFNNIVHYILNINNSNLIHIGNNLSICSSNIENFSNIKGYIKGKKKLLNKRNSDVLIGYNDISNLIIGKDFINFKHIENNGFNINIQIYNKKNTIQIIITLKEKFLDLEKLRNDFYANFN